MKRTKRNITREETNTIVDYATGEVIREDRNTTTLKVECEPGYIKVYLGFASAMLNFQKAIKGLKERDALVLYGMLESMQYDNTIVLDGEGMNIIASKSNVNVRTVQRYRKVFLDIQILLPYTKPDGTISKQRFIVNPNIFGRGKWEDIKELRLQYNYTETPEGKYRFERILCKEDKRGIDAEYDDLQNDLPIEG